MKKIKGWSLIIFCSFWIVLNIVLTGYFLLNPNEFSAHFQNNWTPDQIFSSAISLLFVLLLFVGGIWYGLTLIKVEKPLVIIPFDEIMNITLRGQISFNDYKKYILKYHFNKPAIYFGGGLFFLFLITLLIHSESTNSNGAIFIDIVVVVVLIIIAYPIIITRQFKNIYNTNKSLHEYQDFKLSNADIQISRSDINASVKWTAFIKIVETNHFFLLYQSLQIAVFLNKNMFNENELNQFRRFIQSLDVPKES